MKNFKKYIFCLAVAGMLVFPKDVKAGDMTMSTYYPSLSGEYLKLRLYPRSSDLTGSCVAGSLYINSTNNLQFCQSTNTWGTIDDSWTQNGNNIYLTDGISNQNLNVGIGTTTPNFKLTLINDSGIIAKGTFGSGLVLPNTISSFGNSRFIWYPRKAAFRAGYVDGNHWANANIGDYSAALGRNSRANGMYSVVGGGDTNTASGQYSNVIGGQNNIAQGDYSAITGGKSNSATEQYTTVTGGDSNTANADYATILGGQNNQIMYTAPYSTVGGGLNNQVSNPYSNINGGKDNRIFSPISDFGDFAAVVGGGLNNSVQNYFGVVTGGYTNNAYQDYSSIGGGLHNSAGISDGMVDVNGDNVPSSGDYARVSGGEGNSALGDYSTISGGDRNSVTGSYGTIMGGSQNTATADYSTIGGGQNNTASGAYSMILGGSNNLTAGNYSWAEGKNMRLSSSAVNTFAWGYSETAVTISAANAFIIAPGIGPVPTVGPWNPKVGIRDTTPAAVLEVNGNNTADDYINIKNTVSADVFVIKSNGYIGINKSIPFPNNSTVAMQFGNANNAYLSNGGVWTNASAREYKENIRPLSSQAAEESLDKLQPVTFNYKATPQHTNVGFIAEDVPDLVAMNGREKLSAIDILSVLTKAAQNQEEEIKKQSHRIEMIKKEIRTLKEILGEK